MSSEDPMSMLADPYSSEMGLGNDYYHDEGPAMSDSDDDVMEAESVKSESTISSDKKKRRKIMEKYKQQTTGYVLLKDAKKKKNRIEGYYSSNVPGAPIRNSVSGYCETDYMGKTKFSVGSTWEDLFFKVMDTTSKEGALTFFYDSPEQYERHMAVKLNDNIIKKWYMKHENAKKMLRDFEDKHYQTEYTEVR
jgi:hypothetical protein